MQQFLDPLVIILVAAGVVTCFLRDWVDAGVIFGVVMLNAVVGYIQEAKAVAAIDALSKAMTTEATLIRAGEQLRLPATEIVPGDLVQLQAGDKVPADLRLLRSRELRVDESALTGESLPVEKSDEAHAQGLPAGRARQHGLRLRARHLRHRRGPRGRHRRRHRGRQDQPAHPGGSRPQDAADPQDRPVLQGAALSSSSAWLW